MADGDYERRDRRVEEIRRLNRILAARHRKPEVDPDVWQGPTKACAVRAQQIVLRQFGIDVPFEQLKEEAVAHGWYDDDPKTGGTRLEDLGKLLDLHGVRSVRFTNVYLPELQDMLEAGRACIVAVDSDELWRTNRLGHFVAEKLHGRPNANHAVVVTAVRGDADNDPKHAEVVVTDPGTGEVAHVYSGRAFADAHRDSRFTVVATAASRDRV